MVLTGGVAAFVLLVVGVKYWDDLVVRYHLYRLHHEPGYFLQAIEEPEGTLKRQAVRKYLCTRPGKEALLREYAQVVLNSVFTDLERRNVDVPRTVIEGLAWVAGDLACYTQWAPPATLGGFGIRLEVSRPKRWEAVQELLLYLDGAELALADYPDLTFTILRGAPALERSPNLRQKGLLRPAYDQLSCLITRKARSAVPRLVRLLNDPNLTIRQEAASALGRLGMAASETIPELEALLRERRFQRSPDGSIDYRVQKAAEDALKKIRGDRYTFLEDWREIRR
jgi:hypothetical protein